MVVGVFGSLFWAVMWASLYRFALPTLSSRLLEAPWSGRFIRQQRAMLGEIRFSTAATPPDAEPSDAEVAGLASWLCLTALVHIASGLLALPLAMNGWGQMGTTGHLAFFGATWLMTGWSAFAALDETSRCFFYSLVGPNTLSGLTNRSPRSFWVLTCLAYYPFWLTLLLPMNEVGAALESYHAMACAMMLGGGMQLALKQLDVLLGALSGHWWLRSIQRVVILFNLAVVLMSRGMVFFPTVFDCAAELRTHMPTIGGAFAVAAFMTAGFNVAAVLDAMKGAMWCSQLGAPAHPSAADNFRSRPLRSADEPGLYQTGDDGAGTPLEGEPDGLPGRPSRAGSGRRPKQKRGGRTRRVAEDEEDEEDLDDDPTAWRRKGRASDGRQVDEDDVTFGFASSADVEMGDDGAFEARGFGRPKPGAKGNPRGDAQRPRHEPPDSDDAAAAERRRRMQQEVDDARSEIKQQQQEQQQQKQKQKQQQQQQASAPSTPTTEPKPLQPADYVSLLERDRLSKVGHYVLLGLDKQASESDIKRAFFQLSRKWHPDKNPDNKEQADAIFRAIKEAYECLSEPAKRRRYDKFFCP